MQTHSLNTCLHTGYINAIYAQHLSKEKTIYQGTNKQNTTQIEKCTVVLFVPRILVEKYNTMILILMIHSSFKKDGLMAHTLNCQFKYTPFEKQINNFSKPPSQKLAHYPCTICQRLFKSIKTLDKHIKTHGSALKYHCMYHSYY